MKWRSALKSDSVKHCEITHLFCLTFSLTRFVWFISKEKLFFLAAALQIQPEVSKIKLCSFIIIDYLQMWLPAVHYSTYCSPDNPLATGPLITTLLIVQGAKENLFCSPAAICSCCLYCRTQTSVFIICHKSRSASYEGAPFLPSLGPYALYL